MAVRVILLLSPEHGSIKGNIARTAKLFKIANPDVVELHAKAGMRRFEISDGSLAAPLCAEPEASHTCVQP